MTKLLSKLLNAGTIKANVLSDDNDVLNCRDVTPTSIPIINAAFTGDLFTGGVVSGVSVFAGPSKHFKTTLALLCLKSYLDKYEDSICLFYDNEFGATLESFNDLGIDLNRVVHIPITSIEELRSDISNRLNEIQPGDKVFTLIDSLGNLASKKEIKDAIEDKDAADMTRAKVIKSLFRIITPHFTLKNIPAIVISHVYLTMELFSKAKVSGGTGVEYSANNVFIIGRSQDKDQTSKEILGYDFTINIEKSRFIKEKSKLSFSVSHDSGIDYYSGILELALESGDVIKPNNGWYQLIDKETGEMIGQKVRESATATDEFLGVVLKRKSFIDFVAKKYKLGNLVSE